VVGTGQDELVLGDAAAGEGEEALGLVAEETRDAVQGARSAAALDDRGHALSSQVSLDDSNADADGLAKTVLQGFSVKLTTAVV
jgi:hypothetical protein